MSETYAPPPIGPAAPSGPASQSAASESVVWYLNGADVDDVAGIGEADYYRLIRAHSKAFTDGALSDSSHSASVSSSGRSGSDSGSGTDGASDSEDVDSADDDGADTEPTTNGAARSRQRVSPSASPAPSASASAASAPAASAARRRWGATPTVQQMREEEKRRNAAITAPPPIGSVTFDAPMTLKSETIRSALPTPSPSMFDTLYSIESAQSTMAVESETDTDDDVHTAHVVTLTRNGYSYAAPLNAVDFADARNADDGFDMTPTALFTSIRERQLHAEYAAKAENESEIGGVSLSRRIELGLPTDKWRRQWSALTHAVAAHHSSLTHRKSVMRLNFRLCAAAARNECRRRTAHVLRAVADVTFKQSALVRDMTTYWRRHEREVTELKRRRERELIDKRKKEMELRESERQRKKLEFLLTQTELYSHFIGSKMGVNISANVSASAARLIDARSASATVAAPVNAMPLVDADTAESIGAHDAMSVEAAQAALDFIAKEEKRTAQFDSEMQSAKSKQRTNEESAIDLLNPSTMPENTHFVPTPQSFVGTLKAYQLKGMNWLINLYEQGINGILSDEMGLGKTIQSLAFLSYLASVRGIWGPFLIVCPNSTLHQWGDEVSKFAPSLKVQPYWGTQKERQIIRGDWSSSSLYTQQSPFHVLITSYHILVTDAKYFHRIRWQYLICDEAQALKNANSQRWRALLHLKCRNRVLLTGTPIQNSMAELWALLHFIMPEFFDSHAEFNEWFSKDIEDNAEELASTTRDKKSLDSRQLQRLHIILKPFMLRRVKRDVENELPPKVECIVDCKLSPRQRFIYAALVRRVKGHNTDGLDSIDNLVNLMMHFRKVCNHPELMYHRAVHSPLVCTQMTHADMKQSLQQRIIISAVNHPIITLTLPKLCRYPIVHTPQRQRILHFLINIRRTQYIHEHHSANSFFAFLPFTSLTPAECAFIINADPIHRFLAALDVQERQSHYAFYHRSSALMLETPQLALSTFHNAQTETLSAMIYPNAFTFRRISRPNISVAVSIPPPLRLISVATAINGHVKVTSTTGDDALIKQTEREATSDERTLCQVTPIELRRLVPSDASELVVDHIKLIRLCSIVLAKAVASPVAVHWPGLAALSATTDDTRSADWERSALIGVDCRLWSQQSASPLMTGLTVPSSFTQFAIGAFTSHSQRSTLRVDGDVARSDRLLLPQPQLITPSRSRLCYDSGKILRLSALLRRLYAAKHRVLIFSQMTRMLDLLAEFLRSENYKFFRLDGQTAVAERRDYVKRFQSDTSVFAFILSTRAGGLGINLTAADTVIFYDNDWNPTADAQAMDRTHRIGQTKPVTVYRLVCRRTVEERILLRAQIKYNIQKSVYAGGFKMADEAAADTNSAGGSGESPADLFKATELKELIMAGADDEDNLAFGDGTIDIDHVIDDSAHRTALTTTTTAHTPARPKTKKQVDAEAKAERKRVQAEARAAKDKAKADAQAARAAAKEAKNELKILKKEAAAAAKKLSGKDKASNKTPAPSEKKAPRKRDDSANGKSKKRRRSSDAESSKRPRNKVKSEKAVPNGTISHLDAAAQVSVATAMAITHEIKDK